ncbi:hypothetical protein BCR44DRAFT_1425196 [Catenaria anguillulae PL171]|uniref:ABC transporter domain-containing protein n=1 Tax=Catenaria anguillulae PL171 TaxID=765915 RepID=A0A1Y2I3F4_9FUNG|nr:hypothetical protein BCR44DRAFT_1425196 [Catenaria anguillulae PL171]
MTGADSTPAATLAAEPPQAASIPVHNAERNSQSDATLDIDPPTSRDPQPSTNASAATVVDVGNATFEPTQTSSPQELKSYQVRALVRKTVSYQKRQTVTNICCVTLCPLLMVAMSSLLGTLLAGLIASSSTVEEFVLCSNANAMDPATNQPLRGNGTNKANFPTVDGRDIPGATPGLQVKLTNFLLTPITGGGMGPPSGGGPAPCVIWTEPSYNFTDVYERDPFGPPIPPQLAPAFNASTPQGQIARQLARSASVFQPDPKLGWINPAIASVPAALIPLTSAQQYPWAMIVEPSGVDLGTKDKKPNFGFNDSAQGFAAATRGDSGVLGAFQTRLYSNVSTAGDSDKIDFKLDNFQPVPFFEKYKGDSGMDERKLDESMARIIRSTLSRLSTVDKRIIFDSDPNPIKLLQFQNNIGRIVQDVPWGNVIVRKWDTSKKQFEYVLQIGRDARIARSASFPPQGLRRFLFNSMFANAILKTMAPGTSVVQGLRAFPSVLSSAIDLPIGSFIGRILFPFGVSFLMPIFVITLVKEKEDRIQVMMVMNGLKSSTYFLAHALHFFFLHVVSSAVFLATGIIALAFFLAAFFSKSRNALVVSFLMVLLSVIINVAVEQLFTDSAHGCTSFGRRCLLPVTGPHQPQLIHKVASPLHTGYAHGNDEVLRCLLFLAGSVFVLFFLAWYLAQVLPSQYGTHRPWHFIVTEPYERFSGKKRDREEADRKNVAVNADETQFEDADVKAERARVDAGEGVKGSPLVVRHMRKIYSGTNKIAVKDVTFAANEGEVFGLLGPNGAGKSTLISILTGLYEPTLGEGTIGGYNIATDRDAVYRITGIAPQHDILWDDLTVGEHLLFYARLKGVPPEQEQEAKNRALAAVSLQKFEDRLSKGLSGGEKRRLSIAIALTGSPKVVFLDEPTTGLDPEVRRLIWNILSEARKGKTIVLTTHSMEEAEALCTRIGIMAKGTLRCLGNQLRLKQQYGAGYKCTFIAKPENMAFATEKVLALLPDNAKIVDKFAMTATWLLDDFGISATSLEEVFLRIISEDDAEGTIE